MPRHCSFCTIAQHGLYGSSRLLLESSNRGDWQADRWVVEIFAHSITLSATARPARRLLRLSALFLFWFALPSFRLPFQTLPLF